MATFDALTDRSPHFKNNFLFVWNQNMLRPNRRVGSSEAAAVLRSQPWMAAACAQPNVSTVSSQVTPSSRVCGDEYVCLHGTIFCPGSNRLVSYDDSAMQN